MEVMALFLTSSSGSYVQKMVSLRFKVKSASKYWNSGPFLTSFTAKCLFPGEDGPWAGASVSY